MSNNQKELNRILNEFTQASIQKNKQYNSQKLFSHILTWTEGNTHLTTKLCLYALKYTDNIDLEKEDVVIEELSIDYLLREPEIKNLPTKNKERIYSQKFTEIFNPNQGGIAAHLRFDLICIRQNLGLSLQQVKRIEKSVANFYYQENENKIIKESDFLQQERQFNSTSKPKKEKNKLIFSELKNSDRRHANLSKNWFLLLLLPLLLWLGFWIKKTTIANNIATTEQLQTHQLCLTLKQKNSDRRMSLGEKLINPNSLEFSHPQFSQTVTQGINAFANCNFELATTHLEKSLQISKNQPEIIIYLNNARLAAKPNLRIAVSVPIGSNQQIAQEILRGVAQAQTEINQGGGIKGKLLSVEIANDDNKPEIAREIATKLVKQPEIVAVVGHNSSDASLAASEIYQQGQLVMISPTSGATELSGIGNYIFRTIPDIRSLANSLGEYAVKLAKKDKIAFCNDSSSAASESFLKEFRKAIEKEQGEIVAIGCDFASVNFNPHQISFQSLPQQAEALLLLPSVDSLSKAIAMAKANRNQIPLLGNHSMYTFETIQEGQADVDGMILPVPWLSGTIPHHPFPETSQAMWGGSVNWRTAMAYDATFAIAQGLKKATTRQSLQAALTNRRFSISGATGRFKFENGDRIGKILLVNIQPAKSKQYQFFPLKQQK